MRFSKELTGPWSNALDVFHERGFGAKEVNQGLPIYDALAHPELEREDGRLQYISYSYRTAEFASEMRFLEATLARP
jgi:hypothetical protein